MNNIIKLLSANNDFRIVIADTFAIAEKELSNFTGIASIRNLLEEIITACTLFSAVNDFNAKTSFSLHLANSISIYCKISNLKFQLDFSDELNAFNGPVFELFDSKSLLSITSGDWETGLHTGRIEAHIDSPSNLLAYFTVQSEQIPSHFILTGNNTSRGVLLQPLPFADEKSISDCDRELVFLSKQLEQANWQDVKNIYSHIANVISESRIE